MEDPAYSEVAKWVSIVMMVVILVSTVCFILESEVCTEREGCNIGFLPFEPYAMIFYVAEWISVVLFTIEYNVRFVCCGDGIKPRLKFLFNLANMIDLVAWAPFWITGATQSPPFAAPSLDSSSGGGLGFVRAVRLVRVFRVFKAGKYSLGIRLFAGAISQSMQSMAILAVVTSVAMIIFSSIIWLLEKPGSSMLSPELLATTGMGTGDGLDGMQGVCFGTIPSAFWWALTTMTTVGYGDCYPITAPGKMVAVSAMFSGVIVLALPITVLGSNFSKLVEMYEDEAAEYAFSDMNDDGMIDENELREFLVNKKREGTLRRDVDTRVPTLFAKYDPDKNGVLSPAEFSLLQRDLIVQRKDPITEMKDMFRSLTAHLGDQDQRIGNIEAKVDRLCEALLAGQVGGHSGGHNRVMPEMGT